MTNFEKYKKELKDIGSRKFSVTKSGEITKCHLETCFECIFKTDCRDKSWEWLFEEAEILTENEKELINVINSMRPKYYKFRYIARNVDNNLFLSSFEPYLTENKNYKSLGVYDTIRVDKNLFKNITYETGVFDIKLNKFIENTVEGAKL